ncbi:TetR/AcrR family transcriptional regulator [Rhodococcus aetherivorans]
MKQVEYKLAGMGRHKDVERRRALLEGCCAYAEEQGLFGLTLRPLADRLETSTRNLLHHFGSRENLIVEIVDRTLVTHLTASRICSCGSAISRPTSRRRRRPPPT